MNYEQDYQHMMAQHQEAIRLAEERGRQKMKQQLVLVIILIGAVVLALVYGTSILSYTQTPVTSSIIVETTSTPTYTPLNQPTFVPTQTSGAMSSESSEDGKDKSAAISTPSTTGPQGGMSSNGSKDKP